MNPDTLPEFLQRGFRFTLGATSSLVESLQDPQKFDENVQKLTTNFDQLSDEWVEKGAVTEQEARTFVDSIILQQTGASSSSPGNATVTTTAVPVTSPDIQAEIKDLTAQVIALREEVANL